MKKSEARSIDSERTIELLIESQPPSEAEAVSLTEHFEQIVQQYPQQGAIGSGSWQPTYAQLNAAADALADGVRARCAPGSRVALLHRLDGFLIGSMLGVLKAGRIVAVLNPDEPVARLRQNIEEIQPALIIGEPGTIELAAQITAAAVPVVLFSGTLPFAENGSASSMVPPGGLPHDGAFDQGADDIAFLIQTSGSTGRAKWVTRSQRSILAGSASHQTAMKVGPGDRILLLAAPGSNHTSANLFTALLYGGTICPFPVAEKGIIGLGDWLRRHEITVYVSPASAFRHFLKTLKEDDRFPRIRLVRLASEAILADDLRNGAPHFNEDSVYYCSYNCSEAGNVMQLLVPMHKTPDGSRLHLGNPAAETEILLLDEAGRPVAAGEVGEIVVRSPYLSAGYWLDEKLTAERFKIAADGTRCYYSGDLGRRETDGALYHCGRSDDMVKIRGSRVLLREVEQNLRSQPGVQETVVLARPLPDGSARVAAFVVRTSPEIADACNAHTLREGLAALLPDHALPAEFIFLEEIPFNANGKIDRGALLHRAAADASAASDAPMYPEEDTSTAAVLSEIWKRTLGAPAESNAGFFRAGGDSLTAGVVAARIHAAFAVELDMLDFIQHPRFSDLVIRIDDLRRAAANQERIRSDIDDMQGLPPIERRAGQTRYPLSFAQEGIWRHCRNSPDAHLRYSHARSYGLRGLLDIEAMREAISSVEARNEILRTSFPEVNGEPVQMVHPPGAVVVPLVDFSAYRDARERALAHMREEVRRPMDLENGPLVRHTLVRIGPNEHWVLRVCHHLLFDALSWALYLEELESAYESLRKCQRPFVASPISGQTSLQYGDFAVWERTLFARGSKNRAQLVDWWKDTLSRPPAIALLPLHRRTFLSAFRAKPKPSDGVLWGSLDAATRAGLKDLARQAATTEYTIGLTAFAALLAHLDRRSAGESSPGTVLLGTYVTNRTNFALQRMHGDFAHLVPLCLEAPPTRTFLEWLPGVQKAIAEVQAHRQLPREELWEDLRSLGVTPPEIGIIFRGTGITFPAKFGELDFEMRPYGREKGGTEQEWSDAMPWGFIMRVDLDDAQRTCEVSFDARLYGRKKVRAFLENYLQLLARISSAPQQPVAALCDVHR